jgi:predicted PurR-regulated permease PerM
VRRGWLIAAVAGTLVLAWLARGLALHVFLAMVLAYLFTPLIARTDALAIRRSVAVAGIFLLTILVLVGAGLLVGPRMLTEVSTLAEGWPALAGRIDKALINAQRELVEAAPVFKRMLPEGENWIHQLAGERPPKEPMEFFHDLGDLFLLAILVPFFAFFLLRDLPAILTAIMDRLPPHHVETSVAVWRELNGIIGRYIRGVVLDGIVIAVLAAVGLWAVGVPYPLLLGAFAGIANVVPFIGPLLSAAAAGLVVLLTSGQGLGGLVRVIVLFLFIKILDDTVIQPLTIGRSVHLHPALLLGSVVVGNHTLGVLGMILAVPVATVLQETVRLLIAHRRSLARRSQRLGARSLG